MGAKIAPVTSTARAARSNQPAGLAAGILAYSVWSFFPLYFTWLARAGAVEVVAHRIFWTLVFCAAGITLTRTWGRARAAWADKALVGRLVAAGALVSVNWLVYVWAVLHDHVIDAALGYFINPLVTVVLGLAVLRERLARLQAVALAVGLVAVGVIGVGYGRVPWVGLALAVSFGLYALMKNRVGQRTTPLVGLAFEALTLSLPSVAYIVWLEASRQGVFLSGGPRYTAGLALAGAVTAIPLLFFAYGAARLPLATVGLLQYLTPLGQFLLGIFVFHEAMPPARWAGFALIWVALVLLTAHAVRAWRLSAGSRTRADGWEPESA